jgi:PAS domain S-box-containing protein
MVGSPVPDSLAPADRRTRFRHGSGSKSNATVFASSQLYRALLDNMSGGASLSDEAGNILSTNPAEHVMFGYAPGELLGQHVSVQNAHPDEENQRRVAWVTEHLQEKGFRKGDWHNRRPDGSTFVSTSRITAVALEARSYWLFVQRDCDRRDLAAGTAAARVGCARPPSGVAPPAAPEHKPARRARTPETTLTASERF